MNASEAQAELIEEFRFLDGWMDRYQYLIDLGKALPPLAAADKAPEHKLSGCQSQVWLIAEERGDTLHFRAASDAAIVSGLIAVLLRIYNDRSPAEILATEPRFIRALGFDEHLSPTRSNGLAAMLGAIRGHASRAAHAAAE
ncbi:MAG: SufE family protein [Pseudomonadota bacterium]